MDSNSEENSYVEPLSIKTPTASRHPEVNFLKYVEDQLLKFELNLESRKFVPEIVELLDKASGDVKFNRVVFNTILEMETLEVERPIMLF